MIVKFIGQTSPLELTKGKCYEVLSVERTWYRIVDDSGEDYLYPPEWFEVLPEDPFYSEENMARLRKSIAQMEREG